ncbi:MAG: hypothetical protein AB1649_24290 [Chloroflexota bacterium]
MVTARKLRLRRFTPAAANWKVSAIRKLQDENRELREQLRRFSADSAQSPTLAYKQGGQIWLLDGKRFETLIKNGLDNISLLTAFGLWMLMAGSWK